MDGIWTCRDGIRKASTQMELNLLRDYKNKKGFYRYIVQKRQAKESVSSLVSEKGELATKIWRRLRYSVSSLP